MKFLDPAKAPHLLREHFSENDQRDIRALMEALFADRKTYDRVRLRLAARHGAAKMESLLAWAYCTLTGWAKFDKGDDDDE